MLRIVLLTIFVGLFYSTRDFWINSTNAAAIAASFFGAMGGTFVVWFISYIDKLKNNYDEINYTMRSVSMTTEHAINFIRDFVNPRIDALNKIEEQTNSLNSNIKFFEAIEKTRLLIPKILIDSRQQQINSDQNFDMNIFYKKSIFNDLDPEIIGVNNLKFTLYKDPYLVMILMKLQNSLSNLRLCKNLLHDFIDRDMKGEVFIREECSPEKMNNRILSLREQNDNLLKTSQDVLFFGEVLGITLLRTYNKKYYNWLTRRFLRIFGSGYKMEISLEDEYKNYIPPANYIKVYEELFKKSNEFLNQKTEFDNFKSFFASKRSMYYLIPLLVILFVDLVIFSLIVYEIVKF